MQLNELTDTQVADTFIDQDDRQRRLDATKPDQQLAREKGAQYAADRASNDPLRVRIAQLRQQLAILIQQARKQQQQQPQGQQPQQAQPPQQSTAATPPAQNNKPVGV